MILVLLFRFRRLRITSWGRLRYTVVKVLFPVSDQRTQISDEERLSDETFYDSLNKKFSGVYTGVTVLSLGMTSPCWLDNINGYKLTPDPHISTYSPYPTVSLCFITSVSKPVNQDGHWHPFSNLESRKQKNSSFYLYNVFDSRKKVVLRHKDVSTTCDRLFLWILMYSWREVDSVYTS